MYRPYSSSLTDSSPFLDVQSTIRNLSQDFVTSFNTPPGAEIVPFPSFNPPFHTALALRSIVFS